MTEDKPLASMECPNCNAPLDYNGRSATVKCNFCGTSVAVPKNMRETSPDEADGSAEFASVVGKIIGDDKLAEIKDMLRNDDAIEAIRIYKDTTGSSLKEAKIQVEQIEEGMRHLDFSGEINYPDGTKILIPRAIDTKTNVTIQKRTSMIAWLVVAFVVLCVGGLLAFMFMQPDSPFRSSMGAMKPVSLVQTSDGQPAGVVSQVYHVEDEIRKIIWLDTGKNKTRWVSSPFNGDEFGELMTPAGTQVYLTSGSRLIALNDIDGSILWQTQLTDDAISYENNLVVLGGRVIVMSVDGILQAYDAQTGSPSWTRKMEGHDRKIRLVNDRLLLLDFVMGDDSDFELVLINPIDGSEQVVISPRCYRGSSTDASNSDGLEADDGLIVDETDNSLYLVMGSFQGCVQRYDLSSGALVWEQKQEKSFALSSNDFTGLNTDEHIFFNFYHGLAYINKTEGSWQTLVEDEDYTFIPLTFMQDMLICRVKKSSGSGKFELWGMKVTSGEVAWKYSLDNAMPLDPPDEGSATIDEDDFAWTWRAAPTGFQLLKFQGEPNRLAVITLNPVDGTSLGETDINLKKAVTDYFSTPSIIGWQGETGWMIVGSKVVSIDITTGKMLSIWQ